MSGGGSLRFILLTDIGRSSYLWERFPEEYPAALAAHNRLTEAAVCAHGGTVMKHLGDGYFALFRSASDAVAASVQLQLAFAGADPDAHGLPLFPDGTAMKLRVVVHGGLLQQLAGLEDDWFGTPLNRAARIGGVAHAGQTLISGFVHDRLQGLPAEVRLVDLGLVRLRDLGEPEQLYQANHPGFVRLDFPDLLGMNARPNNLREQPGSFVGREEELAELRRFLLDDQQRLLTLIAPGGYGKSRLANQLCANLLHRYEHGAWIVELAPLPDGLRIAEKTAEALGFSFFSADPPAVQLVNYLRNKKALIHFDNFEHVTEGADLLAEILKDAPGVQCIVTSRIALRLRGEKVFTLAPLVVRNEQDGEMDPDHVPAARPAAGRLTVLSPAVELFADRASLVNAGFNLEEHLIAVMELCQRLDGVPLAVELAAAWADQFTPEELLGELGQQLDLTARMGDVPERQQSVRASCDWSWNLLTADQQQLLMQVSCFRGGFFAEAAQAVVGVSGMQLRGLLAALCDKSWLYTRLANGQTRYSIRDAAAREYAWEKLAETQSGGGDSLFERTRLAHARYFAALADREGPRLRGSGVPDEGRGQRAAYDLWRLELENFRETIHTGFLLRQPGLMLPPFQGLISYLGMTSAFRDLSAASRSLLEQAGQLGNPELEAAGRLALSRGLLRFGQFDAAIAEVQRSLELAQVLQDRTVEARALAALSNMAWMQGNSAKAREMALIVLETAKELDDVLLQSDALNCLSSADWLDGANEGSKAYLTQSLAIHVARGNLNGQAIALNNLGARAWLDGDYVAARDLFAQSAGYQHAVNDRAARGMSLSNQGAMECVLGNFAAASSLIGESLQLRRTIGDKTGICVAAAAAASLFGALGWWHTAAVALHGALARSAVLNFNVGPNYLSIIAATQAQLGAAQAAGEIAADALADWEQAGARLEFDELAQFVLDGLARARGGAEAA